jgi:endoplasmic reticulum Man9GlcNAc2 1,2-alpha-mannosidase
LIAFDTPTKIPVASVNFFRNTPVSPMYDGGASSTAEFGTLQLEFKYLSHVTKNPKYWNKIQDVSESIFKLDRPDGLVPILFNAYTNQFTTQSIRLGSRGDSYYGQFIVL